MRSILLASSAVLMICGQAQAQDKPTQRLWTTGGFSAPESVLVDAAHKRLIVSNINGGTVDEDGNGFLSLLDMDGQIRELKWIEGFDAPTGSALIGDRLYVADIRKIRIVDLAAEKVEATLDVQGAQYLNDVAAGPDGAVYVTDVVGNAIYRVADGDVTLWLRDEKLSHPNGIVFDGDHFIIASWGAGLRQDFSTEKPGGLLSVDFAGKAITPIPGGEGVGNLDGVAVLGGDIWFTDNPKGEVLRLNAQGGRTVMAKLSPGSADLAAGDGTIFVPQLAEGEIVALPAAR